MKYIKAIIVVLTTALLLAGAAGYADEAAHAPGLERDEGGAGYERAAALAERYGVELADGLPLYAPARPQPMNAYMVTSPQCQLGIDGDGMYLVDEAGLVPEITGYLEAWMGDIEAQSGGLIRFVADPDDADVLVSACQTFKYYGQYSGGGMSAEGYACAVALTAVRLSAPDDRASLTALREPEATVTLHGGAQFWKVPPELAGTDRLAQFTAAILGWYGGGAQKGDKGPGVKALQQALADRGFLTGGVDGDFGGQTEAAVRALQESCGLESTGVVDAATLAAVYY